MPLCYNNKFRYTTNVENQKFCVVQKQRVVIELQDTYAWFLHYKMEKRSCPDSLSMFSLKRERAAVRMDKSNHRRKRNMNCSDLMQFASKLNANTKLNFLMPIHLNRREKSSIQSTTFLSAMEPLNVLEKNVIRRLLTNMCNTKITIKKAFKQIKVGQLGQTPPFFLPPSRTMQKKSKSLCSYCMNFPTQ